MNASRRRYRCSGWFSAPLLAALLFVTVVGGILASNLVSMAKAHTKTSQLTMSGFLVTRAAQMLMAEAADADADGYPESTPGTVANGDGWNIPSTSGAPKADAWGSALRYCTWDHGATNSSSGRLTGDNPGTQSSVVFAVISAGPDKTFQTTCAQARTYSVQGDDLMRVRTVAEIVNGVGGSVYFGDPVASAAALATLNTTALIKGEARLQLDTGTIMFWNGTSWSAAN